MRHQGLAISGIRKLVSECALLDEMHGSTNALVSSFDKIVGGRFAKGRRLPFAELRAVAKQADVLFREKTTPVDCQLRHWPGTLAKPKSFSVDAVYIGVRRMPEQPRGFHDVYQLFTFRLAGFTKFVRIEIDYLPLAFQYHAAERLMERASGTEAAFLEIARSLADWSLFLRHAQYMSKSQNGGFMNIPALENSGVLLGEYLDRPPEAGRSIEYTEEGSFETPGFTGFSRMSMFVVSTFVDRFAMRPNQLYAMNRMTKSRADHEDDYERVRSSLIWPGSIGNPSFDSLGKPALDSVSSVLNDPDVVRAMNPDKSVNMTLPRDFLLPLGDWAHEAYRPCPAAPVAAPPISGPFEGLVMRRSR
jgi:hypothetical protein